MKKFSYLLLTCMVVAAMSCRDEDLNPYPETKTGAFVQIEEFVTKVFDVTDLQNSAFTFKVNDEMGNVASYRIDVSWNGADTVQLKTVTEFPSTVSISPAEIAAAYNVSLDAFAAGDRFDFIGTSVGTDGSTYTVTDITQELLGGPGQQQGYRFVSFVSCPFNNEELAGTYVVQDGGGAGLFRAGTAFEIAPGTSPDQYVIVDFGDDFEDGSGDAYGGPGRDLVIRVDTETGITYPVADQQMYDFGFPITPTDKESGFTFSCTGTVNLTGFSYTCCGNYPLILQRQ